MKLLFVCTGNTCRSPMAAAIASHLAEARGLPYIAAASAGVGAAEGTPASDGALLVALEHGVDLGDHRSRPVTRELVAEADLILAMSANHLERLQQLGAGTKAQLLTDYAAGRAGGRHISDPFGADLAEYRRTYAELETEVGRVLDRLAADPGARPR